MSTPKQSLPPILGQAADTASITYEFLNAKDLSLLSSTCKSYKDLFSETMHQKHKASKLLTHVFNADPKNVKEFLSESQQVISDSKELVEKKYH